TFRPSRAIVFIAPIMKPSCSKELPNVDITSKSLFSDFF
ncbi:MAG: hypothetical protein ACI90V_004112, partial [Bacillariaceae sp.]